MKRRTDLPDRKNSTGKDHPVIENYDPEAGLPDVKFPGKGKPVCPTCFGKRQVKVIQFVKGSDGKERMVSSTVPCKDCPK